LPFIGFSPCQAPEAEQTSALDTDQLRAVEELYGTELGLAENVIAGADAAPTVIDTDFWVLPLESSQINVKTVFSTRFSIFCSPFLG